MYATVGNSTFPRGFDLFRNAKRRERAGSSGEEAAMTEQRTTVA